MKTRRLLLLVLCASAMLATSCANDNSSSHRQASQAPDRSDLIEIPPHIGMSKGQVLAQYGRPRAISEGERGEMWVYLLNGGEIATKALIPFYLPVRPRFGRVFFGPDDRVKNFDWQRDPQG